MITKEKIETLKTQLRGVLISPNDEKYDEARTIYNAMIDKKTSPYRPMPQRGRCDCQRKICKGKQPAHIHIRWWSQWTGTCPRR